MSFVLALLLAAADAGDGADAGFDRRTRELMHTRVTVALPSSLTSERREALFAEGFGVFEHVDEVMNEWREDSPLARVNAGAGGPGVEAPADLCDVVRRSLDGARRTKGLFDPTWAALRGLWKFDEHATLPDPKALAQACAQVGYRGVTVSSAKPGGACTIRLAKKGMALGLGGVVKGWGVDQVAQLLRKAGVNDFFVQAGGDLYLGGKNGDRPWRVGIRDPRGPPEATFARLEVSDAAFSTSGDYEHFFELGGVRYHHIIDLRSCQPARASVSATVLAKTALDAELLTKSAFILGSDEGLKLAESFGAQAVLVDPKGKVSFSPALETKLKWWPPSGF